MRPFHPGLANSLEVYHTIEAVSLLVSEGEPRGKLSKNLVVGPGSVVESWSVDQLYCATIDFE